jgi:hypothetical protein
MTERLRIIVSGLVGLYPLGGVAWDYLQYVLGFHAMGHDVYYHEDTWRWPYQPLKATYADEGTYSARFIASFFERWEPALSRRWHYVHLARDHYGMSEQEFSAAARKADVFINVSGGNAVPEMLPPAAARIFLDTDPGYNQLMLRDGWAWTAEDGPWSIASHNAFFTYAEGITQPGCRVPDDGRTWRTTRMPVVTELWRDLPAPPRGAPWTTITTWNAFARKVILDGIEYRSKDAEFERLIDLPRTVSVPLRVALGGVDAPANLLEKHGWQVVDAPDATSTPTRYRDFIAGSRGELSPVKEVYTALRTGWFSTRSACYLAASRPVVVQQTGLPPALSTGSGLMTFSSPEEAQLALQEMEADYERHASAALQIARDYFEASSVLTLLLDDIAA